MDQEIEQTFRGINTITMKLAVMFAWTVCALFHVTLIVLFLSVVWFLEIDRIELQAAMINFYHQHEVFPNLVSFFGVSVAGVIVGIWVYLKLWKKAFTMFLAHYVCKDI
jgi:hypothetical protein